MPKNAVITFHEILSVEWFEEMIALLKQRFQLVSMNEMYAAYQQQKRPSGLAAISFDDGEISFFQKAYPVLRQRRIPVTLFLSPAIIKGEEIFWLHEMDHFNKEGLLMVIQQLHGMEPARLSPFSTALIMKCFSHREIKQIIETYRKSYRPPASPSRCINIPMLHEIVSSGLVTVGAHTVTHPILQNEPAKKSKQEIVDSIRMLREMTGKEISYFAYPNGIPGIDFGKREKEYLKETGVLWAFSTRSGYMPHSPTDPYQLPRIGFAYGNSRFVQSKLKYLPLWNLAKTMRGKHESQIRPAIQKIVDNRFISLKQQ